MGALFDGLVEKAQEAVGSVFDTHGDAWLDALVKTLKDNALKISDPSFRDVATQSADLLLQHREELVGMGAVGLTLFMQQIAAGDTDGAVLTYVKTQADADELIAGMNRGADGIIAAKRKLDALEDQALALLETLTIAAARILLPLLLSLV